MSNDLNAPQPAPVGGGAEVWPLVIEDMRARDAAGRAKYGMPLTAGNGRDALVDAYQEALDLAVYLRQAIAERDAAAGGAAYGLHLGLAVSRLRHAEARVKALETENAALRRQVEGLADRVAGQSELLARRAEK